MVRRTRRNRKRHRGGMGGNTREDVLNQLKLITTEDIKTAIGKIGGFQGITLDKKRLDAAKADAKKFINKHYPLSGGTRRRHRRTRNKRGGNPVLAMLVIYILIVMLLKAMWGPDRPSPPDLSWRRAGYDHHTNPFGL